MKIAIMILAHKNKTQVQRLINHLSKDFDIFVHIDKRSKMNIDVKNNVFIYRKYKTYWSSFNLVKAEIFLLKAAFKRRYDRYILISGQDLPLKTNSEIHNFFLKNSNEYITMKKLPSKGHCPSMENMERLTKYYVDKVHFRITRNTRYNIPYQIKRYFFRFLNKIMDRKLNYDFYGGDQWTNYTHNCVEKILDYLQKNKKYTRRYWWTLCVDEIFFQTIVNQLKGVSISSDCLRYIDWETGPELPRTLRKDDYKSIIKSNALFARKFDDTVDKEIIDIIYHGCANETT